MSIILNPDSEPYSKLHSMRLAKDESGLRNTQQNHLEFAKSIIKEDLTRKILCA